MTSDDRNRLQFTSPRDLLLIFGVLAALAYLLVRLSYATLPEFPRLAGVSAALVGVGEGVAGSVIRARLRAEASRSRSQPQRPAKDWAPLPPLVGARALLVAKASSLAGAGLVGLWVGVLAHVLPKAGETAAAGADSVTATIGAVAALMMTAGALWLERCCVAPTDDDPHGPTGPA